MKYLVDVRIHDREAAHPHIARHLRYLNAHLESGDFALFGAYADGTGGLIVAEAPSAQALDALLREDPLQAGRCAQWRATPFTIGRLNAAALAPDVR